MAFLKNRKSFTMVEERGEEVWLQVQCVELHSGAWTPRPVEATGVTRDFIPRVTEGHCILIQSHLLVETMVTQKYLVNK